jgi:hypothetical protein
MVGNAFFDTRLAVSGRTLKTTATIVSLLVCTTAAEARLSTKNYTCSDVKDLIFQQGAIVLNTKNNSVYRRFVADRSFCGKGKVIKRINVPTKSDRCRLNYCVEHNLGEDN